MRVLSFLLALFALVHLFLHVYNRYLLCIRDSPWKRPIHQLWFFASVFMPLMLVGLLFDGRAVGRILDWEPEGSAESAVFAGFAMLLAFAAVRSMAWLATHAFPEAPPSLIDETVSRPVMPAVPSRLPRGFRRLETTGDLLLVEREIAVSGLAPAFDGFTIAQVSDVHFGLRLEMENYLEGVQRLVEQLAADLVVLTGDFADRKRDIERSVEYHERFRGQLGTFCVLGNHDYWASPERLIEALGRTHIRWLGGGERRVLKRAGRRLIFTGTDAPWNGEKPDWRRTIRRGTGDAVVLLSHTPDNAPVAARNGASMIISGHNHGGQVCLPFFGPFVCPSRYGLRYPGGIYRVGVDSVLNVSTGIGVSSSGIRVLCPPQVCLLTLRAPTVEVMAGRVIHARRLLRPVRPEEDTGGILANRENASATRGVCI